MKQLVGREPAGKIRLSKVSIPLNVFIFRFGIEQKTALSYAKDDKEPRCPTLLISFFGGHNTMIENGF